MTRAPRRSSDEIDKLHELHVGSGPHDGPRCECHHDGTKWLKMCKAAKAAFLEERTRWLEESKANQIERDALKRERSKS